MKEILNHKSIRKYKDKKISKEILNEILQAGVRGSNTGNMQAYSIIVIDNPEIKEKLAPLHFNQPMIKNSAVTLTFCADYNRFTKWCIQRNANPGYDNFMSFLCSAIDATIVAQNVCIAAEKHGLGICYLGTDLYNTDKVIDVLKLPKGVIPITTVTIGYPNEKPELTERLPLEAVIHYNEYNDYSAEQINKLYKEKEELQINKDFVKENNKENLAQVFTDIRYTKENNVTFSKLLLNTLKKQGFMNN